MNDLNRLRQLFTSALPILLLGMLGGCLVSSSSKQHITGNYVPQETFDRIKPGATDAWVKATLGEPSSRESVDQHGQVWKYNYTEQKDSSGAIFLLFGGSDQKEIQHTAYIEFKDGVVASKWRS